MAKTSFLSHYLLGLGTMLVGAAAGAYLFPREIPNMEIYDRDNDGSVDLLIDNNWRILFFEKNSPPLDRETLDRGYMPCSFSTKISVKNLSEDFRSKSWYMLEDCLSQD